MGSRKEKAPRETIFFIYELMTIKKMVEFLPQKIHSYI